MCMNPFIFEILWLCDAQGKNMEEGHSEKGSEVPIMKVESTKVWKLNANQNLQAIKKEELYVLLARYANMFAIELTDMQEASRLEMGLEHKLVSICRRRRYTPEEMTTRSRRVRELLPTYQPTKLPTLLNLEDLSSRPMQHFTLRRMDHSSFVVIM